MELAILGTLAFVGKYLQNDEPTKKTNRIPPPSKINSISISKKQQPKRKQPVIKPITLDDNKYSNSKLSNFTGMNNGFNQKKKEIQNPMQVRRQDNAFVQSTKQREQREKHINLSTLRNDFNVKSEMVRPLRADNKNNERYINQKTIDDLRLGNNKQKTYNQRMFQSQTLNEKRMLNFDQIENKKPASYWTSNPNDNQVDATFKKGIIYQDIQAPMNQRSRFEPLTYRAPAVVVGSNAQSALENQTITIKPEAERSAYQPTADPVRLKESKRQEVAASLNNRIDYVDNKYIGNAITDEFRETERQEVAESLNNRLDYAKNKYIGNAITDEFRETERQEVATSLNNRLDYANNKYSGNVNSIKLKDMERQEVAASINNRIDYETNVYTTNTDQVHINPKQRETVALTSKEKNMTRSQLPISNLNHSNTDQSFDLKQDQSLLNYSNYRTIASREKKNNNENIMCSNNLPTTQREQLLEQQNYKSSIQSRTNLPTNYDRDLEISSKYVGLENHGSHTINTNSKHALYDTTKLSRLGNDLTVSGSSRNQLHGGEMHKINSTDTKYGETLRSLLSSVSMNQNLIGATKQKIQDIGRINSTQRGELTKDGGLTGGLLSSVGRSSTMADANFAKSTKLNSVNHTPNPYKDKNIEIRNIEDIESNSRHEIITSRTTNMESTSKVSAHNLLDMEAPYTSRQEVSSYTTNPKSLIESEKSDVDYTLLLKGTKDSLLKLRNNQPRGRSVYLVEQQGDMETRDGHLTKPDYSNLKTIPNNMTVDWEVEFSKKEDLHQSYFDIMDIQMEDSNQSQMNNRIIPKIQ